jgi:purine-binding chemotaxis protein CheW
MTVNGSGEQGSAAAILRARALALARPDTVVEPQSGVELLEFRLARDRYAVETRHVLQVQPLGELTPVPCTPAFLAGIVNVRGRITAVIDIQKFFALPTPGLTDFHEMILVRGPDFELGLLADTVVGVRTLTHDQVQASMPAATDPSAQYVAGITADRLVVLALDRMLSDPKLIVQEELRP